MAIGRTWRRIGAVVAVTLVGLAASGAEVQERLRWKLAGAYPSSLAVIGQSQIRFT